MMTVTQLKNEYRGFHIRVSHLTYGQIGHSYVSPPIPHKNDTDPVITDIRVDWACSNGPGYPY